MINMGIIGAGRMGNSHASHLATVRKVKLSGVCDVNGASAGLMAKKYNMNVFKSADELIASCAIDAVLICSPTPFHHQHVCQCISAGKHVFCEKPLARKMAEGLDIASKLKKSDIKFAVGFKRRHMTGYQRIKGLIEKGFIGTPRICRVSLVFGGYKRQRGDWFADFDASGGVILDMLAHPFDLLNWYLGKPERIYADSWMLSTELPEPMDYVSGTISFKNKVICNVDCGWLRRGASKDAIEIYGDEGLIVSDGSKIMLYDRALVVEEMQINCPGEDPLLAQMLDFVDSIGSERKPVAGLEEGLASLNIATSMIDSVRQKKVVTINSRKARVA